MLVALIFCPCSIIVAIKRIDEKFYEEEKIREVEESSKRQIHNQLRRSFIQQYEVNREVNAFTIYFCILATILCYFKN